MDDVERLAGGDADATALADREPHDAVVTPEHAAVEMDDLARLCGSWLQARDDV